MIRKLLSAQISAIVIGFTLTGAVNAQEDTATNKEEVLVEEVLVQESATQNSSVNDSALGSDWSFGLQAAPLVFGLSVRRHLTEDWQAQGVLEPGVEASFALRALRTLTRKKYWQSYFFPALREAAIVIMSTMMSLLQTQMKNIKLLW